MTVNTNFLKSFMNATNNNMVQFVCRYHHDIPFYPGERQCLQKPCIKALDVCPPVNHKLEKILFLPHVQMLSQLASWKLPTSRAPHVNTPCSTSVKINTAPANLMAISAAGFYTKTAQTAAAIHKVNVWLCPKLQEHRHCTNWPLA